MAQYQINKYAYALYLELTFTLISQSIPNNTSVVRVLGRVVGTGNGESATLVGRTGTVTFNGVTESFNTGKDYNFPNATAVNFVLFQKDYTVAHNTDGTKSVSGSITWKHDNPYLNSNAGTNTASVSITNQALTTIPRYTTVTTPTISSITRNSFAFSFSTGHTIDQWQYSLNGGAWQGGQTGDRTSGSGTIGSLSANTSYNIKVRVKRKDSQLWTESTLATTKTLAIASPNTPTESSKTAIQIVVNWSSNYTVINVQYSLNGGAWTSTGSNFGAKTNGSFTITGLSPNTNYKIKTRVLDAVHTSSWSGASGELSITTHQISSVTGTNFNLGSGTTSAVTRHTTLFTHDLTLQGVISNTWTDLQSSLGQTGNVTLTPNSTQVTQLQNSNPTTTYARLRWKIVTKSGTVVQGTNYSAEFRGNIINANPTISGSTYKDVHESSDFIAWKGGNQRILRNASILQFTIGTLTSIKGATLKSAKVTIAGKSNTVNLTGTSATNTVVSIGTIDASTNQTAVVEVTDSRGNKASQNITVTILNWAEPVIETGTADRLNNYEEPTTLNIRARYYEISNGTSQVNNMFFSYRYKLKSSSTWSAFINATTTVKELQNGWRYVEVSQFVDNFEIHETYDIHVEYMDNVTGARNYYIVVNKGIALMSFFEDRIEVGVPATFMNGITSNGGGNISPSTTAYNYSLGVLIDICPASLYNMVVVDVIGHGYNGGAPIHSIFQAYHYEPFGTMLSVRQTNISGNLSAGKFLIEGDRFKLWFTQSVPYQTFIVRAYGINGVPYKVNISNRNEPSVTYKTTCTLTTTWNDNNSNAMNGSGSNANGRYIRFSDGTQICWLTKTQSLSFTKANNNPPSGYEPYLANYSWTFPASFATPDYHVTGSASTVNTAYPGAIARPLGWNDKGRYTGYCLLSFEHWWNYSSGHYMSLMAIGRWK